MGLSSPRARGIVAATVLGSGLASLDATVVNVAAPTIGRELGGGITSLQWIVNGYLLTLSALLLLGGSLGDRFGRRRVFLVGVLWFTAASMACGFAMSMNALIAARILQGIGAALLMPGSLAILTASFAQDERASAIGAWSGWGAVTVAIGPFVGGYLVQAVSWRLAFFINLPLALAVAVLAHRFVPESRDPTPRPLDVAGAALAALALGGLTYALIEAGRHGFLAGKIIVSGVVGLVALVACVVVELRLPSPMLDVGLFRRRPFGAANLETLLVYAALGGALFLLPVQLQTVLGYSPARAGAALLPATVMMLLLSPFMARLAQRLGPRLPMGIGPVLAASGMALLGHVGRETRYLAGVLPAVLLLGLGLATTVAPLTATVLAAAPETRAGLASAINNAVARTGGLLAVALLPTIAGLGGDVIDAELLSSGYPRAMSYAALACALGGLLGLWRVRAPAHATVRPAMTCPLDGPGAGRAE